MTRSTRNLLHVLAISFFGASMGAAVAETTTISAVIPWQGQGQVFQTGDNKAQFLGALEGIMYVETVEGRMNEAFVRCPIVQEINLEDGTSSTSASCVIIASEEDTAYAEFTCDGGGGLCKGEFRFTGGEGRLAGIKGKGKMTARSPVHAMASDPSGGMVIQAAAGILQMPELKVTLP
jgi:hypothetical protein